MAPRRYLGRSHLGAAGTWVHRDPFKALLGPLEAGPPVPVGISVECSDTLPPHCAWCEEVPACQPPASPRGNVAAWNRDLPHSPDPWQTCPRIFLHPRESPGSPPPPRLQAKRVSGRLGTFGSPFHPARNVFQLREVALSCCFSRRPRCLSDGLSTAQSPATNSVSMLILVGQLAGSWLASADFTPGPPGCLALVQTKLRRKGPREGGDAYNTAKT